jgi:hypothetical protein
MQSIPAAGERMPRGAKVSPFSPAADYDRDTSEEKSDTEEAPAKSDEGKKSEKKECARSSGRSRRSRRRSRNAKLGRDPSHSYNKRRQERKRRRAEGHGRRRRGREHKIEDKRRRSESSEVKQAAAAKRVSQSAVRPRSPAWDPDKPRTKPCSHCGYEITTQQSGRLQHQWASRNCLTWQFWNQLDEGIKRNNPKAGWDKAKKAAFALYERRRMQAAPYQAAGELAPPPPLLLRSRASVARGSEPLEEMEEVRVEEEPAPTSTRRSRTPSAAPAYVAPRAEQGHAAPAPASATGTDGPAVPAGSTTAQGVGQKQQIVINISSSWDVDARQTDSNKRPVKKRLGEQGRIPRVYIFPLTCLFLKYDAIEGLIVTMAYV